MRPIAAHNSHVCSLTTGACACLNGSRIFAGALCPNQEPDFNSATSLKRSRPCSFIAPLLLCLSLSCITHGQTMWSRSITVNRAIPWSGAALLGVTWAWLILWWPLGRSSRWTPTANNCPPSIGSALIREEKKPKLFIHGAWSVQASVPKHYPRDRWNVMRSLTALDVKAIVLYYRDIDFICLYIFVCLLSLCSWLDDIIKWWLFYITAHARPGSLARTKRHRFQFLTPRLQTRAALSFVGYTD